MKTDPLLQLPLGVRRTFYNTIRAMSAMVPNRLSQSELKEILDAAPTPDEIREFRRYFPDGIFGRITVTPTPP